MKKYLILWGFFCFQAAPQTNAQNVHIHLKNRESIYSIPVAEVQKLTHQGKFLVLTKMDLTLVSWPLEEVAYINHTPAITGMDEKKRWNDDQIFPNPVHDKATLSYTVNSAGPVHITLNTPDGRVLMDLQDAPQEAGTHQQEIATAHLAKGIYLLAITTGGHKSFKKIIVY